MGSAIYYNMLSISPTLKSAVVSYHHPAMSNSLRSPYSTLHNKGSKTELFSSLCVLRAWTPASQPTASL